MFLRDGCGRLVQVASQGPKPSVPESTLLEGMTEKRTDGSGLLVPVRNGTGALGVLFAEPHGPDAEIVAERIGRLIGLARVECCTGGVERCRKHLLEASHDGIVLIGPDGLIRETNPKAGAMLGRPVAEILRSPLNDFLSGLRDLETPQILRVKRPDGRHVEVELTTSRIPEEQCVVGVLHDVTQLRSACQRAEAQCAVAGILAEAVVDFDPMSMILEAIGGTFGWRAGAVWIPAADGLRCANFWKSPHLDVSEFEAETRSRPCAIGSGLPGRTWTGVGPVYVPDVQVDPQCTRAAAAHRSGLRSAFAFPVAHQDQPIAVLEFFSDEVRERDPELLSVCTSLGRQIGVFLKRRKTEAELERSRAELRQAQKMEAIGRLAGGIAHDFNNLLTVIQGYGELLFDGLDADDPRRDSVREIREAGRRAAALTRQLLAFSRKQVLQPRVLDVNETVRGLDSMLRRLIGEDVRLETLCGPGPHRIKADSGQIEQVIMNLAVNARDAMPRGGWLRISTSSVPGSVVLSVSDSGSGMSEEVKAHLFEPFFTTKEKGKGTGLGLSTVYGIVRQSDGQIEVSSELGRGTTFRLLFPSARDGEAASIDDAATTRGVRPGTVVLLIEDEPAVRDLAARILGRNGCQVLQAASGEAAVRIAKAAPRIDLLLSDVVMPGIAGPDAMAKLRRLHPSARVLYMSGYTESRIPPEEVGALLMKPFTVDELVSRVGALLDGATDSAASAPR